MSDANDTLSDGPYAPKAGLPPETPSEVVRDAAGGNAAAKPAAERLGSRTVSGGIWTLGTYFTLNVIRLSSNLILTRILAQELFGTMLVVGTVMAGIRLFSDVGIGPALISNPRGGDEPFLRTAWTMATLRGIGIWLVACILAIPVSQFFGSHDESHKVLLYLLPVAGFAAVIDGLRSTAIFRIQRALRFGPLSIIEVVEMTISSVGMVLLAWLTDLGVWALLLPSLVSSTVGMLLTHTLMRDRRDRWGFDADCFAELMRIGRWIFLSTMLVFFASQSEKLIFGRLVDAKTLGIYGIALGLAAIPLTAVLKIGGSVLFPTFSKVAHDARRFVDVYGRTRTMLLTAGAMIVCGMIACGPFAIRAMYREEFDAAGWMLQILAIGAWFQIVDAANVAALLAQQRPKLIAVGNFTKVLFMLALVPLAYHLPIDNQSAGFRLAMAFVALGLADGMRAFVSTIGVRSVVDTSRRLVVPDFVFPLLIAAVGIGAWQVSLALGPSVDSLLSGTAGKLHRFLVNGTLATIAGAIVAAVWMPICIVQWRRARQGTRPAEPAPAIGANPQAA